MIDICILQEKDKFQKMVNDFFQPGKWPTLCWFKTKLLVLPPANNNEIVQQITITYLLDIGYSKFDVWILSKIIITHDLILNQQIFFAFKILQFCQKKSRGATAVLKILVLPSKFNDSSIMKCEVSRNLKISKRYLRVWYK